MSKTTAVDWLLQEMILLNKHKLDGTFDSFYIANRRLEVIQQAKKLEREQIEDAWLSAWKDSMLNPLEDKYYKDLAEEYYEQTYGGK